MLLPSKQVSITVNEAIVLQPLDQLQAQPLFELVDASRNYLRQWLPWVDGMKTVKDFDAYVERSLKQLQEGTDYSYTILANKQPAGRIGIHYINRYNKIGALGYWIGEKYKGKGIITKACNALIEHCFEDLDLNRIELKCGTGNTKSAAVAERLNFTKEGILRQAEWLNGNFIDLYLYSMLKNEWKSKAIK